VLKNLDSKRLENVMLDNSAYPEGFSDRGSLEFEIPFGLFANGNDIEKVGVKHTETDASGNPLRIIITERKTTPRQVTNTYNMYREGFNPRKGTFVAVVDAFGQPVKITEEQYAKMDPVDREDIKKWEKEVLEGCESLDPEQKRKSEWLRDNVMGNWIFLVDGNSRFVLFEIFLTCSCLSHFDCDISTLSIGLVRD
jgi:hypothetical protein